MSEIPIAPIAKVTGQAIEAMTGNRDFLNEAAKDKPGMQHLGGVLPQRQRGAVMLFLSGRHHLVVDLLR